jgi:hypothetical protein
LTEYHIFFLTRTEYHILLFNAIVKFNNSSIKIVLYVIKRLVHLCNIYLPPLINTLFSLYLSLSIISLEWLIGCVSTKKSIRYREKEREEYSHFTSLQCIHKIACITYNLILFSKIKNKMYSQKAIQSTTCVKNCIQIFKINPLILFFMNR